MAPSESFSHVSHLIAGEYYFLNYIFKSKVSAHLLRWFFFFWFFFFNEGINLHLNLKPSESQLDNDGLASNFPSTPRCTVDKSKVEIDFLKKERQGKKRL